MPIWAGGQGQKEVIVRGERTDPWAIISQALWGAIASDIIVLSVFIIILVQIWWPGWYWFGGSWRPLVIWLVVPWPVWALIAAAQLFIEVFDPNYPPTRKSVVSDKPLLPWRKSRDDKPQPKRKPDYLIFGGGDDD